MAVMAMITQILTLGRFGVSLVLRLDEPHIPYLHMLHIFYCLSRIRVRFDTVVAQTGLVPI